MMMSRRMGAPAGDRQYHYFVSLCSGKLGGGQVPSGGGTTYPGCQTDGLGRCGVRLSGEAVSLSANGSALVAGAGGFAVDSNPGKDTTLNFES